MATQRMRLAVLAATFALVACGGGGGTGSGSGGSAAPAPAGQAPSPAPGPAPAPSPSPPPAPAPAPGPAPAPPSEAAMRGALLYQRDCAGCHGTDPEIGSQGIYKGVTAQVLRAAYGRVQVMNVFAAMHSARDSEDIAAYIAYRVGAD